MKLVATGLLLAVITLLRGTNTSSFFWNPHSLEIVIGGTLAVFLIMTPYPALRRIILNLKHFSHTDAELSNSDIKSLLRNPAAEVKDPHGMITLARDCWELGMNREELERALKARAESVLDEQQAVTSILRNLGKYPPALGMIGTVIGMVQLFSNLAQMSDQTTIGGMLAMAMTATFYGLILSNVVITPVADRLSVLEESRKAHLERMIRLLISIQDGLPSSMAERSLLASA
jgi:chemotaxis protein MotA